MPATGNWQLATGNWQLATARDQEIIRLHVEDCPVCRAGLKRLERLPVAVCRAGRESQPPEDHPGDLQLAIFAEHGYAADDAADLIHHLSRCRECREALVASWIAAVRHASSTPVDREHDARPAHLLRHRLRGALYVTGALLAYAAECVLLAIAVTQFVLAWLVAPVGFHSVPTLWPLGIMPAGAVRFWSLVIACLIGAALLRWIAGHLFLCARFGAGGRGGAT